MWMIASSLSINFEIESTNTHSPLNFLSFVDVNREHED
uniref:Uncharacterized protein n=1 Tax=Rhizophora mucronata TaxID=61149 RepID=A0A2P2IYW0_RHIMU